MIKYIKILVDNYDFESVEEFHEELKNNREEVVKWLQWRADGGKMKNEAITDGLAEASKELLKLI